jgi:hypothetical protein
MILCSPPPNSSRPAALLRGVDRHHQDWSADYKIYSRGKWNQDDLFNPVFDTYLQEYTEELVCVAFDDTKLAKEGLKIPGAFWQRDPMSPPFHVNFLYGLRFPYISKRKGSDTG